MLVPSYLLIVLLKKTSWFLTNDTRSGKTQWEIFTWIFYLKNLSSNVIFFIPMKKSIFLLFFPGQEFSVMIAKAFMFQNLWISVWYFNPPFSSLLHFKSYSHPWLEHLVADNRNVSFICFTYHLIFTWHFVALNCVSIGTFPTFSVAYPEH